MVFEKEYVSGPVLIESSNITLYVSGSLIMLSKGKYPAETARAFISNVVTIRDVRITGGGAIGNIDWLAAAE